MRKNKVEVITMGCAKNLVDSEVLMQLFASSGYSVEHDPELFSGEIVVINTCGFIESAREESINMILDVIAAKKRGDVGKVYVMGCLSERYREELEAELPEVDGFYGKFNWKELVHDLGKAYHTTPADLRLLTTPPHYAYVKIAEGCNQKCAYCSIPIMTGGYKSRPMEEILSEVEALVQAGTVEIQLIAQDLTYYGVDRYGTHRLPELVEQICAIEGIEWVRLHYAYPTDFPTDLLRVMREQPKVCKYLDIALQHSTDHMLRLMRRRTTAEETEALLARIRREVPGIHIRTTLMVGHPGETEADFESLLDFVRRQRFERMGAFIYSHEEGTYGYRHYEDDIPAATKQERLDRLMELQEEIALAEAESKVGTTQRVIIDRLEEDYAIGRTQYDSPDVDPEVYVTGEGLRVGHFYQVRITSSVGYDLVGEAL